MAKKYVAAKDLTIDGRKIEAGTPLFTIEVDGVDHARLIASLGNGAAVPKEAFDAAEDKKAKDAAEAAKALADDAAEKANALVKKPAKQ